MKKVETIWLSLALVIIALFNWPWAFNYTFARLIVLAIMCAGLSGWWLLCGKETNHISKSVTYIGLLLCGWILVSSFLSTFIPASVNQLSIYLVYFALFVLASQIGFRKQNIWIWLICVWVVCYNCRCIFPLTVSHEPYIFHKYSDAFFPCSWDYYHQIVAENEIKRLIWKLHWHKILRGPYSAISFHGNINYLAGYLVMFFPVVLLGSLYEKGKKRLAMVLTSLAILYTLYWIRSDASFIGAGASLLFLYFLRFKRSKIMVAGGILAVFLLLHIGGNMVARNATNHDPRISFWQGSVEMIKERPVKGWGPGTFLAKFQQFRPPTYYYLNPQPAPLTDHPHNYYLEMACETGIPSVVLFIALMVAVFKWRIKKLPLIALEIVALSKWKWGMADETAYIYLGSLAGILAILVDNLVSTNLTTYTVAPLFWLVLGGLCYE